MRFLSPDDSPLIRIHDDNGLTLLAVRRGCGGSGGPIPRGSAACPL